MKVILIDDEQLAIDVLEIQLGQIGGIEIVGKFTNPYVALKELQVLTADLVFLDMEMGDLHGLELAKSLATTHPDLKIAFVTAHPQFALEAFEVNAIDYLLKPVEKKRLEKTISKLKRRSTRPLNYRLVKEKQEPSLFAQVMGDFRLLDDKGIEVKWRTKKVKELFILLWHHREEGIHRSQIIMSLWPELPEDRAVALMHTTIYQLRKAIREMGFNKPVILRNEQYILNISVKSDVEKLKNILTSSDINESLVEEAITLYRGDFIDIENYEWSLSAQESIRNMFLNYLAKYITFMKKAGRKSELIEHCLKKMINLDPYSIQYTSLLLKYYGQKGNKQKLIALFQESKTKWIDELGLDIPREILELYEKYIQI